MNARIVPSVILGSVVAIGIVGYYAFIPGTPTGEAFACCRDPFRAYGESVFRLQNGVLDDLIRLVEFPDGTARANASDWHAAERRIVGTCRYLNEAANIVADGRAPGLALDAKVIYSIGGCKAAALAVKTQIATNSGSLTSPTR